MKIPIVTGYLNYLKDKKTIETWIDNAKDLQGLYEGAIAQQGVGSIFQILQDQDTKLDKFKEVSIDEYLEKPIPDITKDLVLTNPNISQMQTVYSVLIAQDHKVTASSDAGQSIIDEVMMRMEDDNTPWSLAVQHMASSIVLRGNVLLQTEFDDMRTPLGIKVVDPKWYKAELQQDGDRQKWFIGRYVDGEFQKIESPNIRFQGINTLVGERLARSPLQTAVWPALAEDKMLKTLQSLMDVSLFSQRIIKILELEIAKILPNSTEADRKALVTSAEAKIKVAGKTKPNQPIVLTDNIEVGTSSNGSTGITWVDILSRLFDRKIFSGGNQPPFIGGSNEFVAESSSTSQLRFFSAYLGYGQLILKECSEWAWTRILRSQGNSDDVIYTSKTIDSFTRVEEAQTFNEIMKGIRLATSSGIPIDLAIMMYEESSGNEFTADIKERIIQL